MRWVSAISEDVDLGRAVDAVAADLQGGLRGDPVDLLVVNLYPFRETIAAPGCTLAEAIEQS